MRHHEIGGYLVCTNTFFFVATHPSIMLYFVAGVYKNDQYSDI